VKLRTDYVTASQIDLVLALRPGIGWLRAWLFLASVGVPVRAARVMPLQHERRPPRSNP
jgi:hypothetical protein